MRTHFILGLAFLAVLLIALVFYDIILLGVLAVAGDRTTAFKTLSAQLLFICVLIIFLLKSREGSNTFIFRNLFWCTLFFGPIIVVSSYNTWLLLWPPAYIIGWIVGILSWRYIPRRGRIFWGVFLGASVFIFSAILLGLLQGRL